MSAPVRSVVIITKAGELEAVALGRTIAAWLAARGLPARVAEHDPEAGDLPACPLEETPCLLLVLGGDGTFISVARRAHAASLPLLGLNMGHVGFWTELTRDNWEQGLSLLLERGLTLRPRLLLAYRVLRGASVVFGGFAVNELTVGRGSLARLVRLSLFAGGEHISSLRADGLIVSTPSGSTAYCVSAGGPILHQEIAAYCVTPVCPFLNDFRPLVLPARVGLSIRVEESTGEVWLTEDGQAALPLVAGDLVEVARAPRDLLVAETGAVSYFSTLKDKGFLTGGKNCDPAI